jgi:hypothetical protein
LQVEKTPTWSYENADDYSRGNRCLTNALRGSSGGTVDSCLWEFKEDQTSDYKEEKREHSDNFSSSSA